MGESDAARTAFLNVDAGELDDEPEELYALAHLANVACGGHAGQDASMRRAVSLCLRHGTALGAHPSYADRAGFGRRALDVTADALEREVAAQCARLAEIARDARASVTHVKPHGALYHAANADPALAHAVVRGAVRALGAEMTFVGPPAGALREAARSAGLAFAGEAFADRGVRPDGSLVPRGEPDALVHDPEVAAARAMALARDADVATVCVHGDGPNALAIARAVRRALDAVAARAPRGR